MLPWLKLLAPPKRSNDSRMKSNDWRTCESTSKELWVVVEHFKKLSEFEGALFAAVERFKKSPEFLEALGANGAYGVCSFFRKYKEKFSDLCSDYQKFRKVTILLDLRSSPWMPLLEINEIDSLLLCPLR
ncbi:hypothetical protein LIER_09546 [Lithospermum erythrorhizon]|uniref:Uncharacterized protein n=1 Tax=Lithospermum erythrorhizon TaxID=34254 RepID=A0AAV3PG77_LITER